MNKESLAPLTGVLFLALLIASFTIAGEPPEADSAVGEIVDHYVDNKDSIMVGSVIGGFAAVALLFFAAYLRKVLSEASGPNSMLPGLVLVGASIIAVGAAIDGTISIAIAEAAEDIDPTGVQTLQAFWDNDFLPFMVGMLTFLLAAGLAIVRTGALPKWLGWVALVLVVVGATPVGFAAFVGTAVWVLVVSVLLAVRGRPAAA